MSRDEQHDGMETAVSTVNVPCRQHVSREAGVSSVVHLARLRLSRMTGLFDYLGRH